MDHDLTAKNSSEPGTSTQISSDFGEGLSEKELADRVAGKVASYLATEQISRTQLSKLLRKGPNYIAAFLRDRSEMGVFTFYKLCRLANVDPNNIFGFSAHIKMEPQSLWSDELEAISLLETALARIRSSRRSAGLPYIDEVLAAWRGARERLEAMDVRISSFLDLYDPPNDEGELRPISLGRRSLVAQALGTNDVSYFNSHLKKLPRELVAASVANQQEALKSGYIMVSRAVDIPLLNGKRLLLNHDILMLRLKRDGGREAIAHFSKAYSLRE